MFYIIATQQLIDSDNKLIKDFSNSRVLNRLSAQDKITSVKKFCDFRFATQPIVLGD